MAEPILWRNEFFEISTDKLRLQVDRIHKFLSADSYWSQAIPLTVVENAIANSLCFGLFNHEQEQVGFARVVTDSATFAWLCDVYVEESTRGQGLSKWLIECVMRHPDLQGLRRICLATKDAHSLYEKYGFEVTKSPANWMEIKDDDIYLTMRK